MGELSHDTVVRLVLGSMNPSDRRMLESILAGMSGVTAFEISDDGVLIASLGSADLHGDLARALTAAGVVPLSADELGTNREGGGEHAC